MNKRILGLALLAVCLTFGSAYAADGDIYRDAYTSSDSTGNWTFSTVVTGNKNSVTLIASPSDTTSTVTTAKSGGVFVLTGQTGPNPGGVGYTVDLPTAASGLNYTFTTATNQTISVRSASASDVILWGNNGPHTRYTSPASTGSTIVVVGHTNKWYVTDMATPKAGSNNSHDDWVAGTR
jgi:hypothetical protein